MVLTAKRLGPIDLSSGCLSISDSSYFYDEHVEAVLPPGRYDAELGIGTFSGHQHVMTIRVARNGMVTSRRAKLGVVPVDFGQIGICDRTAVSTAFDALGDEGMPLYFQQLQIDGICGEAKLPGTTMFLVRPGFGDGAYDVFELVDENGNLCGIEVDCNSAPTPNA